MERKEMTHVCGMFKSDMSGIHDALEYVKKVTSIPEKYDLSDQTRPVIDQGSQGICVSVCVGDMVTYAEKQKNKNVTVHIDYFYNKRNNTRVDGMTPREALEIASNDFGIRMFAKIQDPDTLKKSIIMNGPCMICLPCYSGENEFWKDGSLEGGHAVVLTGWDRSGFILKNSWGWSYGESGYTIFPYEDWDKLYEAWTIIV